MPRDIRAKVTLPFVSGLATDVAVNDFSLHDPAGATLSDIATDLISFYNDTNPAAAIPHPIAGFLSPVISRVTDVCRVDIYDRANPPGSPPEYFQNFTLGAPIAGAALVEEVAACLSFDNGPSSTRREKGRIFLGPLNVNALATTGGTSSQYLDQDSFIPNCLEAAKRLDGLLDDDGWEWQVWSPTNGSGVQILRASMDNAPDTIRSRGAHPTLREYITIP